MLAATNLTLLSAAGQATGSEATPTQPPNPGADPVPTAMPLPAQGQPRQSRAETIDLNEPVPPPPRPEPPGGSPGAPKTSRPADAQGQTKNQTRTTPRSGGSTGSQQLQIDRDGLITMHVNELDVRVLLELLSRRSGANILVSPNVSGNITANFEKVTQDQLLSSVLKLANLEAKHEGTIQYIYTQEEMRAEQEVEEERADSHQGLPAELHPGRRADDPAGPVPE